MLEPMMVKKKWGIKDGVLRNVVEPGRSLRRHLGYATMGSTAILVGPTCGRPIA